MAKVMHPEDLIARIKRMENEIAQLKRGSTLNSSVLSRGTTEVRTDSGQVIQRAGAIPWAGSTVWGVINYRVDGTVSSINWDAGGASGYWAFFDEAQNIVASNDTVSGIGLATPYIPYTAMPYTSVTSPPQATTLGTFERLHRVHGQRQHPVIRTQLIVQSDAATTGEVQLAIGGVAITVAPTAIPAATNSYYTVDAALPGDHLAFVAVDVEARRTAGAGSIRVAVAFVEGKQS